MHLVEFKKGQARKTTLKKFEAELVAKGWEVVGEQNEPSAFDQKEGEDGHDVEPGESEGSEEEQEKTQDPEEKPAAKPAGKNKNKSKSKK